MFDIGVNSLGTGVLCIVYRTQCMASPFDPYIGHGLLEGPWALFTSELDRPVALQPVRAQLDLRDARELLLLELQKRLPFRFVQNFDLVQKTGQGVAIRK